tara:strand:- start:432 stop:722 length:291 start_codon:yes stop_codon:yes gene_type:complete
MANNPSETSRFETMTNNQTISSENFTGITALTEITISEMGYGHGKFTAASPNTLVFPTKVAVSPAVTIPQGTFVKMKFSSIKTSAGGEVVLHKGII